MSCVYAGTATEEQLHEIVMLFDGKKLSSHETDTLLESICCNDAAPWPLLERMMLSARKLSLEACKRGRSQFIRRRYRARRVEARAAELERTIAAALIIHPATPADIREGMIKELRRRHVKIDVIRRTNSTEGWIGVSYEETPMRRRPHRGRYRHHRPPTPKRLRERAAMLERHAKRMRKSARVLQRKLTEKKHRKEKAMKAKAARMKKVRKS